MKTNNWSTLKIACKLASIWKVNNWNIMPGFEVFHTLSVEKSGKLEFFQLESSVSAKRAATRLVIHLVKWQKM